MTKSKIDKKADQLKPVYLITGDDAPKVAEALKRLKARIVRDAGTDMNIDIFDALDHGVSQAISAAQTLPFGEGLRLVVISNAGAWRKAEREEMALFLADPPQYSCIALVGKGIKKNEKLYRAVESAGAVLAYDAPRPVDLPRWAQQQAALRRIKMGIPEAKLLVRLTGADLTAITNELDKLAAFLTDSVCEANDIEQICWVSAETRIWDLTDALGARNSSLVFKNLEKLLAERHTPAAIFFSLAKHMRCLFEVASARQRGDDPLKHAAAMGLKPYPAKKAVEQSVNFNIDGLRKSIQLLSDLDADIKGRTGLRPDFALEKTVVRILKIC